MASTSPGRDVFLQISLYVCGLVLWDILRRCNNCSSWASLHGYQIRPTDPTSCSCTRPCLRPSLLSAIKDRKIKTTPTFRGDGNTCQASKKMQKCLQEQTESGHGAKELCTRGAARILVILLFSHFSPELKIGRLLFSPRSKIGRTRQP